MEFSISIVLDDEIQGEVLHAALKVLSGFEKSTIVKKRLGGCDIELADEVTTDQLEDLMARSCDALNHLKELLGKKSVLCVAIYFEEAYASVLIGGEILSMISTLPVDLEITTYPVS